MPYADGLAVGLPHAHRLEMPKQSSPHCHISNTIAEPTTTPCLMHQLVYKFCMKWPYFSARFCACLAGSVREARNLATPGTVESQLCLTQGIERRTRFFRNRSRNFQSARLLLAICPFGLVVLLKQRRNEMSIDKDYIPYRNSVTICLGRKGRLQD